MSINPTPPSMPQGSGSFSASSGSGAAGASGGGATAGPAGASGTAGGVAAESAGAGATGAGGGVAAESAGAGATGAGGGVAAESAGATGTSGVGVASGAGGGGALSAAAVALVMDATVLKPEATRVDVDRLIADALELGCGAICVSPSMLPVTIPNHHGAGAADVSAASPGASEHGEASAAASGGAGSGVVDPDGAGAADVSTAAHRLKVATVAGFPSGKHASLIKATEARFAVQNGAEEVDVVIDIAAAIAGDKNALISELMTVREAVPQPVVLKVILESAALTEEQLRIAVQACIAVGVDYVKTSTGFHPAGGASVRAVAIMAEELRAAGKLAPFGVPEELRQDRGLIGIKASGGIRDWDTAIAMINAGATRLGVSAAKAILDSRPTD